MSITITIISMITSIYYFNFSARFAYDVVDLIPLLYIQNKAMRTFAFFCITILFIVITARALSEVKFRRTLPWFYIPSYFRLMGDEGATVTAQINPDFSLTSLANIFGAHV